MTKVKSMTIAILEECLEQTVTPKEANKKYSSLDKKLRDKMLDQIGEFGKNLNVDTKFIKDEFKSGKSSLDDVASLLLQLTVNTLTEQITDELLKDIGDGFDTVSAKALIGTMAMELFEKFHESNGDFESIDYNVLAIELIESFGEIETFELEGEKASIKEVIYGQKFIGELSFMKEYNMKQVENYKNVLQFY